MTLILVFSHQIGDFSFHKQFFTDTGSWKMELSNVHAFASSFLLYKESLHWFTLKSRSLMILAQRSPILYQINLLLQVLSRSGKAEVLTNPHRPYGNNKVSLQEIKRIREAGGWVCFPVLCFIFPVTFSILNILFFVGSLNSSVKGTQFLSNGVFVLK